MLSFSGTTMLTQTQILSKRLKKLSGLRNQRSFTVVAIAHSSHQRVTIGE
jgi:hypothetical protein